MGTPAPEELRAQLASLVAAEGERAISRRLGIPPATLARLLGGLGVRQGTIALVQTRLAANGNEGV